MAFLFDLDGTLTDPKPGIVGSIRYALDRLDARVPQGDELDWCIGPPLAGSFVRILGTDDPPTIAEAVRLYRERFSKVGLYENSVYPGIADSLARLRAEGLPLFVATSKPHVFALRILDHFSLKDFFDGVYGSELDGLRSDKGELIAHVLRAEGLAPSRTIMVGDREHDVIGARANGVASLGVTYGYGTAEELDEAGAAALCTKPERVGQAALDMLGTLALSCEGA